MEDAGDQRVTAEGFSAKRYFQDVIDGLTDDLKIVDRQYRVVFVNRTAAQRLFKDPHQILGRKCFEVFNHFDHPCPFCTTQRTFETGETLHTQFGYTDTDGDPYFFLLTTFPIRDKTGKIVFVVEVTRDVTQEKRLEQEVVHSRTLKAIGQFAAELAHEVRNPLNAMTFQMALLKKVHARHPNDPCTKQLAEISETVNEEISRLTKITRDFLTFTHQDSLNLKPVDVEEAVRFPLALLKGDLERSGVVVSVSKGEGPLVALLDRDRFRQVMINLLTNAMEALAGGGMVRITLTREEGGKIGVTVTDDGPGIPKPLHEKIFIPFFSTKKKGSGLGLSIVKNIVEAHGGTIALEPTSEGASFKMIFPEAP